jgi:hypothetical protein
MTWVRQLKKMVRRYIRAFLDEELQTHLPCEVISYDADENLVSLQPCINAIRMLDADNLTTVQMPRIDDVPVQQFGSGKVLFSVAPQEGSYGNLHVTKHRLETWLTKGGIVDPNSSILFDANDGFFDPGVYPLVIDGDNGKLIAPIQTDRIEMRTRDRGGYISLLSNGIVHIQGDTDFAVAYTDLKSAFDTLKTDLNALVTAYNAHVHITTATVSSGSPGVLSATVSTGTASAADMAAAKLDTIKVP